MSCKYIKVNTMKIYDWSIATISSNANKIHNKTNSKIPVTNVINVKPAMLEASIKNINADTTCNNICPANTLANNRKDKLTTLNI